MPLKRIPVARLRKGMYLKGIEGSWLAHSFWKTRFVIEDDATLERIRTCGAQEVWIDVSQGFDVADVEVSEPEPDSEVGRMLSSRGPSPLTAPTVAVTPAPSTRGPEPAASRPVAPSAPRPVPPPTVSLSEELRQAGVIRERARQLLTNLYADARMGRSVDTAQCEPVVNDVVESIHRNGDAIVSLARLKLADEYTYMHSLAVCALMVSLGRQLGLDDDQCREAGMAGLLHDLGKAAMPPEVLNKPGKLTDAEFDVMRQHPVRGWEMLQGAGVRNEGVLDVVRHHHERFDGQGYPDRLAGEALSQVARMGAICDVYDAVTSNRPYKGAWDPAESIAQMASWKGHFDPDILKAFIRAIGIYPTGSLVRLASGKLAIVLEQNPQRLTAPKVKVFFSTRSGLPLRPTVVDLAEQPERDRIEARESPEKYNFGYLNSLWAGDSDIAVALDDLAKQRRQA